MKNYVLTAFKHDGELLMDEVIQANNDEEAKTLGEQQLATNDLLEQTHRLVSPDARLLLFHR